MTKQNPMKVDVEEKPNCTSKVDSESPKEMINQNPIGRKMEMELSYIHMSVRLATATC